MTKNVPITGGDLTGEEETDICKDTIGILCMGCLHLRPPSQQAKYGSRNYISKVDMCVKSYRRPNALTPALNATVRTRMRTREMSARPL